MTNAEYHALDGHVSCSMLKVYRKLPDLYRRQYVTQEYKEEPTAAMRFGSLVDCLLLTPDQLLDEFTIVEASTRGTNKYKDHMKDYPDLTGILAHELKEAQECVNSVNAFPDSRELLDRMTERQKIYRWTDPATGRLLKAKLDLRDDKDACDLKTASSIESPWWEIDGARKWHYDMQGVMYSEGAKHCGEPIERFFFIVVESSYPFPVRVCEMGPIWRESGKRKFDEALMGLSYSESFDDWRAEYQQRITVLGESQ